MQNNDVTGSWASGEPIPGTDIGALASALVITEFLAAINGPKGELDAWLEVHDEKDCRAIFKAAFSPISAAKVQGAAPTDDQIEIEAKKYALYVRPDGAARPGDYDVTQYECREDFFNCVRACIALATPSEPHALSVLRQISQLPREKHGTAVFMASEGIAAIEAKGDCNAALRAAPADYHRALYEAAIGTYHKITEATISLYRNPRLEGTALSQMADRLAAVPVPRVGGNTSGESSGTAEVESIGDDPKFDRLINQCRLAGNAPAILRARKEFANYIDSRNTASKAAAPAKLAARLNDDQIMDMAEPFHDIGGVKFDEVAFARSLMSTLSAETEKQAARYRYLRNQMAFTTFEDAAAMSFAPIAAPTHNFHTDWVSPKLEASVDATVDAAIESALTTQPGEQA